MTAASCLGGWCDRRDACAHHVTEARDVPVERLCEPGKADAWVPVEIAPKRAKTRQNSIQRGEQMSLPRDISRCLGVRHSGPIVVTCHERNNCRRYLAAASGDFGPRTPNSPHLCTTPQREMQINSERQS